MVDFAVVQALRVVRVRAVEKLRLAAGDADRLGRADPGDLRLERALAVEHLDAVVAGVGHVEIAASVGHDPFDPVELALSRSGVAPGLDEVAVLRELRNPVVRAETVGDVNVARAIPRHVRGPVERVAVDAGSRGRIAASAAATLAAAAAASFGCGRPAVDDPR